jgi:hypothetical protein
MADELNPEYISQLRDANQLHASGADARRFLSLSGRLHWQDTMSDRIRLPQLR